jgi:hypothetical protein
MARILNGQLRDDPIELSSQDSSAGDSTPAKPVMRHSACGTPDPVLLRDGAGNSAWYHCREENCDFDCLVGLRRCDYLNMITDLDVAQWYVHHLDVHIPTCTNMKVKNGRALCSKAKPMYLTTVADDASLLVIWRCLCCKGRSAFSPVWLNHLKTRLFLADLFDFIYMTIQGMSPSLMEHELTMNQCSGLLQSVVNIGKWDDDRMFIVAKMDIKEGQYDETVVSKRKSHKGGGCGH